MTTHSRNHVVRGGYHHLYRAKLFKKVHSYFGEYLNQAKSLSSNMSNIYEYILYCYFSNIFTLTLFYFLHSYLQTDS